MAKKTIPTFIQKRKATKLHVKNGVLYQGSTGLIKTEELPPLAEMKEQGYNITNR